MDKQALIVEDDTGFGRELDALLTASGFRARTVRTVADAREAMRQDRPSLAMVKDLLADGSGFQLLGSARPAPVPVVIVAGHASLQGAVEAGRLGALDYLSRPIDEKRLRRLLRDVARGRPGASTRARSRRSGRLENPGFFVGDSHAIREVYRLIRRVGPTSANVFLSGESGTGKDLAARAIHGLSRRRDRPFVAVNCGAIAPGVMESELFGHEKGSFTGAERRRSGYFERASGGTLFLDEIGEMPADLQVKLLRVLESGRVLRVGGTEPIEIDVRVIAATNRDPQHAVSDGALREDLYYRLNVFPIELPPLRERTEDVEALARHFLDELGGDDTGPPTLSDAAVERLRALPWTGNVRELRNVVERAMILANGEIGPEVLPEPPAETAAPGRGEGREVRVQVGCTVAEAEEALIRATLESTGSDKRQAARTLGISLKTLYNRLNLYRARGEPLEPASRRAGRKRDPA